MATASTYSRADFLRDFECIPEKEFEFNGRAASWAPAETGPRFWDEEDERIDVPFEGNVLQCSALALTPDEKFLAIAVDARVWVYDVETLRLCARLAPHPQDVSSLHFRPRLPDGVEEEGDAGYLLVSTTVQRHDESPKIYLSTLKANGSSIDSEPPGPRLLAEGTLPTRGSGIWSPGGSRMLYLTSSETERGPEVVVFDAVHLRETCRLQGHRDLITYASWSPDGTLIATASWDGTYGIWVALSGVRLHSIPTFGQNWCCDFMGDGHRLVVSGGSTT